MSIPEFFERKLFFKLSRHLWNIAGVSGFISILAGLILFFNSFMYETPKTKEELFGKRRLITSEKIDNIGKEMMTFEEWNEKKNKESLKPLTIEEWAKNNGYSLSDLSGSKADKIRNKYNLYQDELIQGPYENRWNKYYEYKKSFINKESVMLKRKDQQDQKFEQYLNQVVIRNSAKIGQRALSPLVMTYGLAVIASASISSALLAVERNTRKE